MVNNEEIMNNSLIGNPLADGYTNNDIESPFCDTYYLEQCRGIDLGLLNVSRKRKYNQIVDEVIEQKDQGDFLDEIAHKRYNKDTTLKWNLLLKSIDEKRIHEPIEYFQLFFPCGYLDNIINTTNDKITKKEKKCYTT